MKTVICYYSSHHGNTKKVLDAIAGKDPDIDLINISGKEAVDLKMYDRIGIASGIYYSDFAKPVYTFVDDKLPGGKSVFLIYTSGMGKSGKFTEHIKDAVMKKGCSVIGEFGCEGFDTFGPLRLVGGVKKGHPNEDDLQNAVKFYKELDKTAIG